MRALIVFESMFGNTKLVAEAVCQGLSPYADTRVVEVGAAPERLDDVDLVVAGGPTHAFGMTRPGTRADAASQASGGVVSGVIGLREWLASLPKAQPRQLAATFDSRVDKVRRLPGSAARGAAKRLRHLGFRLVAPPESFYVTDTLGPLLDGELDRARRWGAELGSAFAGTKAG
jgi:hypothetical protein